MMQINFRLIVLFSFLLIFTLLTPQISAQRLYKKKVKHKPVPFYKIKVKDIYGKTYLLNRYKGKPVLIINIASESKYSSQIEDMETLYEKYFEDGLVVLGVPSNDFGSKESKGDIELLEIGRAHV